MAFDGRPGNADDTPAPLVPLTPDGATGHVSAPLSPVRATHVLAITTIRCCSARAPYSTDQCQLGARETTSSDSFAVAFLARARCELLLHRAAAWRGAHYSWGTSATAAHSCMGLPPCHGIGKLRPTPAQVATSGVLPAYALVWVETAPGGLSIPQESCRGPVSGPRARYDHRWDKSHRSSSRRGILIFIISDDSADDGGARCRSRAAARADSINIKLFVIIATTVLLRKTRAVE